MAKLTIWVFTLIGLTPSIIVALAGFCLLRAIQKSGTMQRYGTIGFVHDSYFSFMFGSWRVDFNPQYWSIAVLLGGIALIVVGLISLLHT